MALDSFSIPGSDRNAAVRPQRAGTVAGRSRSKNLLQEALAAAGIRIDGRDPWDIHVHDERFYDRVLIHGSLGLGESYTEGWWDCERIDEAIRKMREAELERRLTLTSRFLVAALEIARNQILNRQTPKSAVKAAKVHYDLDLDLFRHMLGPTMVYSCAYWKDAATLDRAQENKLDLICRKLLLQPSDRVMDIGCGWGSFLKHAASRYGCNATGITVSSNQWMFAQDLCRDLPVRVLLADYRDPCLMREGRFDKIASVGMFEHVGRKNYRTLMKVADALLKEDGLFLLHTIGRGTATGATDPWLEKYIFPNGMLPSAAEIADAAEGLFVIQDWHSFGADYDRTLMAWLANFEAYAEARPGLFTQSFQRMWRYYLACCAGSFRARRGPQLWQIVLSKGGVNGYGSVR
jgi:cyclopropane-fatty-acyl-phospholipid synthase